MIITTVSEPTGRRAHPLVVALMVTVALGAAPQRSAGQGVTTVGSATGAVARMFELRARTGMAQQFEDGYRRHLDWHVGAGDQWVWYLWQVMDGERAGLYVDGTFGHEWAAFDAAVDPSGDAADNARNVNPFATREANHAWRSRPDLGSAPGSVVDLEGAAFVLRAEYRVRPGADTAFVRGVRRIRAAAGERRYLVYELVSGGEGPTYVVWAPAATWADLGAFADRTAAAAGELARTAERVRTEVWRFRADLSICRTAAAHCHRSLEETAAR